MSFMGMVLSLLLLAAGAAVGWLVGRRTADAARAADRLEAERRVAAEREGLAQQRERAAAAERDRDTRFAELSAAQADLANTRKLASDAQSALARAHAETAAQAHKVEDLARRLYEAEQTAVSHVRELRQKSESQADLQARLESQETAHADQIRLLKEAEDKLADRFKVLAADIFGEKSKTFRLESESSLNGLLNPLKERLGEFQQKVDSLQKEGLEGRVELRTQIENLRNMNDKLSTDANNLAKALKNSSKQQGDWGEILLIGMLEEAGLRANHEYQVQQSFATEEGRQARPDIILNLPDDKHLVIDSKVSLAAYSEYCATEDDAQRRDHLERHTRSLQNHIDGLSKKSYQALHQLRSLDFVVMFVPIEPAYLMALAHDGSLWQRAWKKDVLLVSPGTLFPVIRTIAHIWQQERQTRNVEKIVEQGTGLYNQVALFANTFEDLGKKLSGAQASYEKAHNQLAQGKGNVIRRIEQMRKLGLQKTKSLPASLLSGEDSTEELTEMAELTELPLPAENSENEE